MENRHLSITHPRNQVSEACIPPYSSDIGSRLPLEEYWFPDTIVCVGKVGSSSPRSAFWQRCMYQPLEVRLVRMGVGRRSERMWAEHWQHLLYNWKHYQWYIWLMNTLQGGYNVTVAENICLLLSTLLWNQFISSSYRVALIVPLYSLPLVFYPFTPFSIPHALSYSTPVGIPVLLTSPFSSWFFPDGNPKPSESSLRTNIIMMGDNMIIISVMITFVDWMLHWSLLPAVTKMAEEALS